ncbi:response regulator [Planktotalea sp.]|uniref:response regulator n=1 Tax=Planktotalea sp. TaxID=2029877 RepID=UPI003D6AF7FA
MAFSALAFGVNSALTTVLHLDRLQRVQWKKFDDLTEKFSFLFTLDTRKSSSTTAAVTRDTRRLIEEIKETEVELHGLLSNIFVVTRLFIPKEIHSSFFDLDEAEIATFEKTQQLFENETLLKGVANIAQLKPVETSFIQSAPWDGRFDQQTKTLERALARLATLESSLLIASAAILVVLLALSYLMAFRPSFAFLNRSLERQADTINVREGLISLSRAIASEPSNPSGTIFDDVKLLSELSKRHGGLKGMEFSTASKMDQISSETVPSVTSSEHVSNNDQLYLVASLPVESDLLRNIALPYMDVLSQQLRLRDELKIRHRAENDRDKFLEISYAILENFSDPVLVFKDDLVIMANPAACTLLNSTQLALTGVDINAINLLHDHCLEHSVPISSLARLGERPSETSLFNYHGGKKFEWRMLERAGTDQKILMAKDVTEILRDATASEQKRKLETLGKVSGTIAHDINNFLAVIQNTLELVTLEPSLAPTTRKFLDAAQRSCDNAVHLNRTLVSYSQKQDLVAKRLRVSHVIPELQSFVNSSYSDIDLVVDIKDDPEVLLDQAYLVSSLVNVIKNCATAMNGTGQITLELSLSQGEFLHISLLDSGPGFSQVALREATQPFFSDGKIGTGLGLSSVEGFALQSEGWIELQNSKQGAQVDLFFPTLKTLSKAKSKEDTNGPASVKKAEKDTQHLFLLEDNIDLASLIQSYFGNLGYTLDCAHNIQNALEVLEHSDVTYDAMMLDLVLPDGNGIQVASSASKKMPNIPIVFMTGYGDEVLKNSKIDHDYELVQKPFVLSNLKERVDGMIRARFSETLN